MLETVRTVKNPPAAGLSAVQVGVLKRVFIARDFVYTKNDQELLSITDTVFINPKIISLGKAEELDWEGCLSIPEYYGMVMRSKKVKVKYTDLDGKEQRLTATDFLARVIQHEMDHLEGVLFTSKVVGKLEKIQENIPTE